MKITKQQLRKIIREEAGPAEKGDLKDAIFSYMKSSIEQSVPDGQGSIEDDDIQKTIEDLSSDSKISAEEYVDADPDKLGISSLGEHFRINRVRITKRQLSRIIREQIQSGMVELTSPGVNRSQVSAAWPEGVLYNGQKVFDIFYQRRAQDDAWSLLRHEGYGDGQEAYLGYSPSADVFIMGFDAFLDEDDGGWEDDSLAGGGYGGDLMDGVTVEMDPSGRAIDILEAAPGGMYPTGLKAVKMQYPDIIDVRLD